MRIAAVYDIPFANNRATADFLLHSDYMNSTYVHEIKDYSQMTSQRVAALGNAIAKDEA